MAEFGVIAAKGPPYVKALVAELVAPGSVPEPLRQVLLGLVRLMTALSEQIAALDKQTLAWHRANPCCRRRSTIDGFGPILSSALALRAQQPQRFACGRDLSAWIGLAPKQNSSSGKVRLGAISKKGDVYLRRLLINSLPSGLTRWGVQAVLNGKRATTDPWIARLLHRKPRLVVAVALANKMARVEGEGLRGAINNRHCATLEKGGNAEQAPRPTLAVKTMAHRNARRFSLATEPQFAAGATGETFGHPT